MGAAVHRTEMSPVAQYTSNLVRKIFAIPAIWDVIRKDARMKIVKKGEAIGLDMASATQSVPMADLEQRLAAVTNPDVQFPAYYTVPFHAYDHGNLSWNAALEVEMASKAVNAAVMDPAGKALDSAGDDNMRTAYHEVAARLMRDMQMGDCPVRQAVDLGCSVGISSQALQRATGASVIALDASPYFIAVAEQLQDARLAAPSAPGNEAIDFRHTLAENTGLADSCADLVSMCFVFHELPTAASHAIMTEAFRIVRPGGWFTIMELDPEAPACKAMLRNPFASAAFTSTEPWLSEYVALDMEASLRGAGFDKIAPVKASKKRKAVELDAPEEQPKVKAPKKDKVAKSATSDAQKPAKKTKKAEAVESSEAPAPEIPEPVADIDEPKKAVKVKRSKKVAAAAVAMEEDAPVDTAEEAAEEASQKRSKTGKKGKAVAVEDDAAPAEAKPAKKQKKQKKSEKALEAAAEAVPAEAPAAAEKKSKKKSKKAAAVVVEPAVTAPAEEPAATPESDDSLPGPPPPQQNSHPVVHHGHATRSHDYVAEEEEEAEAEPEKPLRRSFQRVKSEDWIGKKGSMDNTYVGTFGEEGWGFKAQQVLGQVRGKDFRAEKTKKKRGSYFGGKIDDNARHSFKYDSD